VAVTDKPWNGDASRFSDAEYARSCILDLADCMASARDRTAKERYKLPIREPSGALNVNALGAAAAALASARTPLQACRAAKATAARKLLRAYREAGLTPPDSLTQRAA
jgi:hypothetical protein